jgi:hypothetical protein
MTVNVREYGTKLVLDLLDAANGFEYLARRCRHIYGQ